MSIFITSNKLFIINWYTSIHFRFYLNLCSVRFCMISLWRYVLKFCAYKADSKNLCVRVIYEVTHSLNIFRVRVVIVISQVNGASFVIDDEHTVYCNLYIYVIIMKLKQHRLRANSLKSKSSYTHHSWWLLQLQSCHTLSLHLSSLPRC